MFRLRGKGIGPCLLLQPLSNYFAMLALTGFSRKHTVPSFWCLKRCFPKPNLAFSNGKNGFCVPKVSPRPTGLQIGSPTAVPQSPQRCPFLSCVYRRQGSWKMLGLPRKIIGRKLLKRMIKLTKGLLIIKPGHNPTHMRDLWEEKDNRMGGISDLRYFLSLKGGLTLLEGWECGFCKTKGTAHSVRNRVYLAIRLSGKSQL